MKKETGKIVAGGTYDEENLANVLEFVKNFDVFSFTLPGHESRKDKATREATQEPKYKKLLTI